MLICSIMSKTNRSEEGLIQKMSYASTELLIMNYVNTYQDSFPFLALNIAPSVYLFPSKTAVLQVA